MSPEGARLAVLRRELARDWDLVRTHLARARSVDPRRGDGEAALVALSLDHAYQAFESLLVRLERALGLPERGGVEWHRAILGDAALPLAPLRPAIYPPEVERDWDDVRRFRHFLRHAYTVDLDAERLAGVTDRLHRAVVATEPWLEPLLAALA